MAKKKPTRGGPPQKAVLYVEIDPDLKERLVRLADLRSRKITAEAVLALRRYVAEEEEKEGLGPIGGDA
jgi:predicted transcriptional regulator